MNQSNLHWQIAEQKGRLVGRWTDNGFQMDPDYYPSYSDYKDNPDIRLQAKHVQQGVDPRQNPKVKTKLVAEPKNKGLKNEEYRKNVKSYADHWRGVMKERKSPTGLRGVRHSRTVQV